MSDDEPAFRVECPDCDLTHESETFEDVSEFVSKHDEHTGHQMEWVRTNFDLDLGITHEWELTCETCEETWRFDTVDAAREYRTEHAEYTDHEIETEPEMVTAEGLTAEDLDVRTLRELIGTLEGNFEDGVPVEVVVALLSEEGIDVSTVESTVEKLKQQGELYEPVIGHVRTT